MDRGYPNRNDLDSFQERPDMHFQTVQPVVCFPEPRGHQFCDLVPVGDTIVFIKVAFFHDGGHFPGEVVEMLRRWHSPCHVLHIMGHERRAQNTAYHATRGDKSGAVGSRAAL